MLKQFSAAKTVQSKSVPKMVVFRKSKGLHIKYSHRESEKANTLAYTFKAGIWQI